MSTICWMLFFSFICCCIETSYSIYDPKPAIKSFGLPEHTLKLIDQAVPIVDPSNPSRHNLGVKLKNGLKILLIEDPQAAVSAGGLSVQCGHIMDPEKLPGLSHLLEHVLLSSKV